MNPAVERTYLAELVLQAEYALTSASAIEASLRDGPAPVAFFRELQGLLSFSGAASRILWPPRGRDANGRQVAEARSRHLREVLSVDDSHALHSRALRDHLEHFDERLDRWSQESTHGSIVDLHIGPATPIGGAALSRGDFLHVYEPERHVFTFRGDEFDVRAIVAGLRNVRETAMTRALLLEQERRRTDG